MSLLKSELKLQGECEYINMKICDNCIWIFQFNGGANIKWKLNEYSD